jgi:diguanylate cyclase (GGDEF)-like protein
MARPFLFPFRLPNPQESTKSAWHFKSPRQLSLLFILSIVCSVQILTAVGVMTTLVLYDQTERTAEIAEQWQMQMTQHVKDQLQHQLSYPLLIDQLNQDAIQLGQLPVDSDSLDVETLHPYFWRQLQQVPSLAFTGFASEQGSVIAVERTADQSAAIFEISGQQGQPRHYQVVDQGNRGSQMTESPSGSWFDGSWLGADWQQQHWHHTAIRTRQPSWTTVLSQTNQTVNLGLVAGQSVYLKDQRLGVLFAGISLDHLSQSLQNIQKGQNSKIFILERTGALVATSVPHHSLWQGTNHQTPQRRLAMASSDPVIRQVAQQILLDQEPAWNTPRHLTVSVNGHPYHAQFTPYGNDQGLDWLIGVVTPASTWLEHLAPTSKRLWLLCLLPLAVILLTTRYLSQRIAQPLLQMGEASQRVAQGFFHGQIPVGRVKELATLATSFNQMAREVFQSRQSLETYSLILEQRVAERTAELEQEIRRRRAIEEVLHQANQELERLAFMDGLTQIANRRHFNDRLNQEWLRLRRMQAPLSLILCDIDYFKQYNDTCGHLAGDECLRQVATLLRTTLKRPADLVARYGGEEFAILLPETSEAGAVQIAQKIQINLQRQQIVHPNSSVSSYITLSLGIATLVPHADMSFHDLIDCADRALYEAKSEGRNGFAVGELSQVPSLNALHFNYGNQR